MIVQLLRNRLFGLQQVDGVALAAAPPVLLACALRATFLAARRAADVNVIEALNSER